MAKSLTAPSSRTAPGGLGPVAFKALSGPSLGTVPVDTSMVTVASAAGDEAIGSPLYQDYAQASKRLVENPHGNSGALG